MPIRRLPPLLVNQIAAGEVVERPASVVKELLENAIDAGATRIEVRISGGGRDLIEVTDDGAGIAPEELVLAVTAHATSTIADASDLESIATMGFRGEALASIASVSQLRLCSRRRHDGGAAALEVDGGTCQAVRPAPGPPGTQVTVRNLFFNTPARRRFLRSERAEFMRIGEVVEAIALAQPAIGFVLRHDERRTLELPSGQDRRERVVAVLGAALATELLELEDEAPPGGPGVWGMIGTPAVARSTARAVRLYLNGRPIQDRSILHAVREGYRGLIEPTRAPVATIFLRVDPAEVDVNVHPAKSEVRFRNAPAMHRLVHRAIVSRLRRADLVPAFDLDRAATTVEFVAPLRGGAGMPAPAPVSAPGGSRPGGSGAGAGPSWSPSRGTTPSSPAWSAFDVESARHLVQGSGPEVASAPAAPEPEPVLPVLRPAGSVLQVHKRYLVTQDEQGLVIIDQHALHERVMFERLRARVESGPLESQRLLVPALIEVDAAELECLDELGPLFARLGIEASPMGPRSVGVHAFPSLLFERGVEPGSFLRELLRRAADEGLPAEPEAALSDVLDMMACKAAIRSGDRLGETEIAALLAERERIERHSNCPHGRPTTLRLTISDLDRQFGRT